LQLLLLLPLPKRRPARGELLIRVYEDERGPVAAARRLDRANRPTRARLGLHLTTDTRLERDAAALQVGARRTAFAVVVVCRPRRRRRRRRRCAERIGGGGGAAANRSRPCNFRMRCDAKRAAAVPPRQTTDRRRLLAFAHAPSDRNAAGPAPASVSPTTNVRQRRAVRLIAANKCNAAQRAGAQHDDKCAHLCTLARPDSATEGQGRHHGHHHTVCGAHTGVYHADNTQRRRPGLTRRRLLIWRQWRRRPWWRQQQLEPATEARFSLGISKRIHLDGGNDTQSDLQPPYS
jgi:hypothetical protein